jgi:predicted RNA binding protein YcfA (HicA-like mRNA interferase family)
MTRMPQVTSRDLLAFLRAQGFHDLRQEGSHLQMCNSITDMVVTVPVHKGCDMGRGLAARILRDAGFSVEDYIRLR